MKDRERDWLNFLPKLSGWILGLITFVTAVAGFVELWQGNRGLVTIVLLVTGVGGGSLGCAYLSFKRTVSPVEGGGWTWQYPRWRPWALAGLFIIPLLVASGVGYTYYRQTLPTSKTIILIADFDGPKPEEYGVTDGVLNNLNRALQPYDDVEIEILGRTITERGGSAVARIEGNKRKATIVIWGWYRTPGTVVPLSVNFEVLRPPQYLPELRSEAKGQIRPLPVADLESFALQTRLSAEMAYLSLFTVGMARYTAEDWDGALTSFSDALSQNMGHVPALDRSIVYFMRGATYIPKGDFDRAIADYNQAIEFDPNFTEAYANRGVAYRFRGDVDRAIADYSQAIRLDPSFTEAYFNRGVAYRFKGDVDRAIADYNQAIKLDANFTEAYYNRGLAHKFKGDVDRAIADFSLVIKLAPDFVEAYVSRGFTYTSKGDIDRAIADYNQAIKLDANCAEAFHNRGFIYFNPRRLPLPVLANLERNPDDIDRAIADYNQAIKLDPNFAEAFYSRGLAYLLKGNLNQEAIADFNRVLELSNDPKLRELAEKQLEELRTK